eukprot:scaffold4390_cov71-Skeletonema_dohrnii-CCMP3373.AAC.6
MFVAVTVVSVEPSHDLEKRTNSVTNPRPLPTVGQPKMGIEMGIKMAIFSAIVWGTLASLAKTDPVSDLTLSRMTATHGMRKNAITLE